MNLWKNKVQVRTKLNTLTTLAFLLHLSTPSCRWPSPPCPQPSPSPPPSPSSAAVLVLPCPCRLSCPVLETVGLNEHFWSRMQLSFMFKLPLYSILTFWQNCSVNCSTVASLPPRNPSFRTLRNMGRYLSRMARQVFTWKLVNLEPGGHQESHLSWRGELVSPQFVSGANSSKTSVDPCLQLLSLECRT